jgi:hypothetical protein
LNQAHLTGQDVPALVDRLKAQATPAAVLVKAQNDARLKELHEAAAPVLSAPDPLKLINRAVKTLGYGAPDPRFGACGSLFNIPIDTRLNHRIEIISGVMEKEAVELMQLFFREVRKNKERVN